MDLPPAFHDQPLGDLMARATEDSGNVRNGVYWMMWSVSIGFITILNVIVVMILLDRRLALVAALMLPLLMGWSALAAHSIGRVGCGFKTRSVRCPRFSRMRSRGPGSSRFGRDEEAIDRYDNRLMELYRANRSSAAWSSAATPAITGFGGLGLVVVVAIGGSQALKGNLDVGTFVRVLPVRAHPDRRGGALGTIVVLLFRGMASSDRFTEMLARRSDLLDPAKPIPATAAADAGVRFDDVSFQLPDRYRPALTVFRSPCRRARRSALPA